MQRAVQRLNRLLLSGLLSAGLCLSGWAKSYSSGGHSYSSHSYSHSSSYGGGSHSFSSGSHSFSSGGSSHSSTFSGSSGGSHSSSFSWGGGSDSGSRSFRSSSGKSYSSSSIWDDNNRKSYSSGKSYTAGSGRLFSSGTTGSSRPNNSSSASSGLSFDTAAAHARKEESSKQEYTRFKESQAPPIIAHSDTPGSGSYRVSAPPLSSNRGYYRPPVYIPDYSTISTRSVRVYNIFNPYMTRPVIYYHDPYSSLFWWWLLDRSLDDRAWWAYNHRYDMDPDRYQALLAQDAQLQARVSALEAQQTPRDPNYTPAGVDRDLMYSDQYIARAYNNRPTPLGVASFRVLGVMCGVAFAGFFIWLIWFKRWQTA